MGDEARRFLRYVMPGLVYGVETLLFLFIVMPEFTVCVLAKLSDKHALGASVSAFLASSGALGYIFAAVHHRATLRCEKRILDQREIVKKLCIPEGLIKLDHETMSQLDEDTQEARQIAESISLSNWYRLLTKKHKFGTDGIDRLKSQAHALGTARTASVFALVTTVLLSWWYGTPNLCWWPITRFFLMVLLGGAAIYIFHYNYQRVLQFAQDAFNDTLKMLLTEYAERVASLGSGKPVDDSDTVRLKEALNVLLAFANKT